MLGRIHSHPGLHAGPAAHRLDTPATARRTLDSCVALQKCVDVSDSYFSPLQLRGHAE